MAKVLKDFRCKVTKRVYRKGETYDGDRLGELQKLGFVEALEDDADETAKSPRKRTKHNDNG